MTNRTLFFGDNLEVLRDKFSNECIDLIYLDPPFNSNKEYNILFKEGLVENNAQLKAFDDSWHWTEEAERTFEELIGARKSKTKISAEISGLIQGFENIMGRNDMMAYLVMMTIRLMELHRVLKSTGLLYIHCDPTASHYLKIILDVIFDKKNFRNEIIWCYAGGGIPKVDFPRKHDIIFRYSKTDKYYYNPEFRPYSESTLKVGGGRHSLTSGGKKVDVERGTPVNDWWADLKKLTSYQSEWLGFQTQKPETLLERIIKTSSKENDLILDPFCGCGTTIAVAEGLNRRWVGIDITTLAINIIKHRLEKQFHFSIKKIKIEIDGIPKDLRGAKELAEKNRLEFQYWALSLFNCIPSKKKGADEGIDGIIIIKTSDKDYKKILVQVKSGGVQRSYIATLNGDMKREKAIGGVFVTLKEPTKPMKEEASKEGFFKIGLMKEEYPKIQIITIKELLEHKRLRLPSSYMPYQEVKGIKDLSTKRDKQKKLL